MSAPAQAWRVEQQVKSRMGAEAWLPVGETYPTRSLADAGARQLEKRLKWVTRVVPVRA
ncbi:MAG: hypothetical protein WCO82_00295 [Sphingomonadales bacterium]|jgi:hypothetical protein